MERRNSLSKVAQEENTDATQLLKELIHTMQKQHQETTTILQKLMATIKETETIKKKHSTDSVRFIAKKMNENTSLIVESINRINEWNERRQHEEKEVKKARLESKNYLQTKLNERKVSYWYFYKCKEMIDIYEHMQKK